MSMGEGSTILMFSKTWVIKQFINNYFNFSYPAAHSRILQIILYVLNNLLKPHLFKSFLPSFWNFIIVKISLINRENWILIIPINQTNFNTSSSTPKITTTTPDGPAEPPPARLIATILRLSGAFFFWDILPLLRKRKVEHLNLRLQVKITIGWLVCQNWSHKWLSTII